MKRRLLALATALVMIIGLLPATILTVSAVDTPSYLDFTTADANTFPEEKITANSVSLDTTCSNANGVTNQITFNKKLAGITNPHITQTIRIDDMPVYPNGPSYSNNFFQFSGYFNSLHRNLRNLDAEKQEYVNASSTRNVRGADYLLYSIYPKDTEGNLWLSIFKMTYNIIEDTSHEGCYKVSPVLESRTDAPLNKTLGQEFVLGTVWNSDGTAEFYVDGERLSTFYRDGNPVDTLGNVTSTQGQYGSTEWIYFGYLGTVLDEETFDGGLKLSVSNMSLTDGHTPGDDDGDCTTPIPCAVCGGAAVAGNASHTFNRKIATSAYAKDGETGVFYTSCSVCGTSSAGKDGEATFTAVDISGGTKSNYYTLDGNYAVTLYRDNYTHATNGTTDLDNFTLDNLTAGLTEVHLSQTITIDNMTKFSKTVISGNYNQHSGFYNVFYRNQRYSDPEDTSSTKIADWLMYTIQRRDDDGSLYLILAYSPETSMTNYKATFTYHDPVPLGKKLGETFRLTTVWNADNSASFYVDGVELVSYEAAEALTVQERNGASEEYFKFGYYDTYTVEAGYEGTAKMTVSALTVNDGCIAEEDDGDCTTAVKCAECGEIITPANENHTAREDDGNCTTDILCVNCSKVVTEGAADHTPDPNHNDCGVDHVCAADGCNWVIAQAGSHTPGADDGNCATAVMCSVCGQVATAAHVLIEVPENPATNTTDGMKAHWKCETCDVLYATADGTGGVVDAATLVIPKLAGKVEVEVTQEDIDASEGDVSLDVTDAEYNTSSVQMSNASLAMLEQSGKSVIITTDEGVVTVDAAALAAIKTVVDTAENMAIKVKQEANSVLSETQKNALSAYPTLRTVVKAELLVAGTETSVNFGEGAVTVKIPFTPGLGVAGSAYKLVYVSDEGQIEEVPTTYETGYLTATLRHFSDYAIVSEQAETEIIEDTIDRDGGSATQNVYGTYKAANDATVFSVDVNWGSLNFTYQAEVKGTWNAATHQYDNAIAEGWLANNEAYVEVVNHSNVAIDVAVTKNAEEIITDVGVTLTNTEYTLASGTTTTFATADSNKTTIEPYGTLTEGQNNVKIAEITVTITEANAQS